MNRNDDIAMGLIAMIFPLTAISTAFMLIAFWPVTLLIGAILLIAKALGFYLRVYRGR